MILKLNDVKEITSGAVSIGEEDGYFTFERFNKAEKEAYSYNIDYYKKTVATAGVKLDFYTDSEFLYFNYRTIRASSKHYCFFDIYINGIFVHSEGDMDARHGITDSFKFELPKGENRITVFLPNLFNMQIKNIELSENAVIRPYLHRYSVVCYGDSITQGYDAVCPSFSYVNRLCFALDADVYNKAIGGDRFFPELLDKSDIRTPDFVMVAYGTNDWSHLTKQEFEEKIKLFFQKINSIYKNSKILVITPIWRKDNKSDTEFGTFDSMIKAITDECEKYRRFFVLKGEDLLPHNDLLFYEDHVHPNDLGMTIYADSLFNFFKKYILE